MASVADDVVNESGCHCFRVGSGKHEAVRFFGGELLREVKSVSVKECEVGKEGFAIGQTSKALCADDGPRHDAAGRSASVEHKEEQTMTSPNRDTPQLTCFLCRKVQCPR